MLNTLAWTLVHFLWQGALLALIAAAAQRLLQTARARYAIAAAVMLAMPLCAVATFYYLAPATPQPAGPAPLFAAPVSPAPVSAATAPVRHDYLPWLAYAWMAGVLLLSLRLFGQWTLLQRYRRTAVRPVDPAWQRRLHQLSVRLRLPRAVRLYESAVADVPAVVGWLRPVILIPVSALTQLTPGQVEALLAHELAHIRRHDYVVNLLQSAVETLFFYHPAVWWVGRCMRQEREHCCDDAAVELCGDPVTYARALADLEQLRLQMPALAMAANGGSLLHRIQRLVLPRPNRTAPAALWITAGGLLATALAVWAAPAVRVTPHALPVPAAIVDAQPTPEPSGEQTPAPKPAPNPSGTFLDDIEAAGMKDLSVDQMVAMKIHNVTGDYIRSIRAEGFQPTPDKLVALRIHNVTPEFIHEMKGLGWSPTLDQLVAFRIHNLQAGDLAAMKQLGYTLDADQAVAMKIHGLTPDTVKALNGLGYGKATFDQLMAMRIHGIDPDYAASWKQAGLSGLTLDNLVALRIHNATAGEVKEVAALGYSGLSAEDVVRMRIFHITPEFIREAQKHGFKGLSFDRLVRLKQAHLLDRE